MKKQYLILTLLTINLLVRAGGPPPPPPSGYQPVTINPQQPTILVPPQLNSSSTQQNASPHPTPSATPQSMTNFLKDPNIPLSAKSIAISGAGGSGAGISLSGQTTKIRPGQNYKVPQAVHAITNGSMASWTQSNTIPVTTDQLFEDPQLAQAYQNFIDAIHENPRFLPLFRKLHIVALHQIYLHLTGIYITLNMTNITDIKSYLALEKQFGLNKKTLIINELVKIIQSQLTQALLTLMPGIPLSYCIKTGMTVLGRDNFSNPDALVLDLEKSALTVLGVAPLSNNDVMDLYSALTSQESIALIEQNKNVNTSALQQALPIIAKGPGFVKQLVQNPPAAQAVIAAIDTILGEEVLNTSNANYQAIVTALESGSMQRITEQQMNLFQETIKQITSGSPLEQEIMAAEQFGKMIIGNDPQPLSQSMLNFLASIIGFILQNYEQKTSTMLGSIVTKLETLNPQFKALSPLQKIQLQKLAEKLAPSSGQPPLALDAIPPEDRSVLATGLIRLSSSSGTTFSRIEQQILVGIGEELAKGPITAADLNGIQLRTIKKALTIFRSYSFQPVTQEEMLAEFSSEELNELTSLCNDLSSSTFKDFKQFSTPAQILLLRMYQGLMSVVQTRLYEHQQASRTLQDIFSQNPELQSQLFNSITANQYVALNSIDQLLKENNTQFSFSLLSDATPAPQPGEASNNPPISTKDALAKLFVVNNNKITPSYISILYQLREQNTTNQALQNIIASISPEEQQQYQMIAKKASQNNFVFSNLTIPQRQMLVRNFLAMRQTTITESMMEEAQNTLLAGTPSARLQTIAMLIAGTMNFSEAKTSCLWVLKQYLIFFNLYCATLQEYESNGYKGLTLFEQYAQDITEKLKGTEIEKLNPPIFFYNKETLNSINMLPQLAQLIENTSIVPYPTFSVLLAMEGSTVDPLNGQTYTNQVNYGNFSYNKFFFIDTTQNNTPSVGLDPQAYQAAPELTGQAAQSIQWIKKVPIPASTKTTSYTIQNEQGQQEQVNIAPYNFAFFPTNVPPGVSGFYTNIPIFSQDPTNPRQQLIRLYEQPIYAQPAWLNYPGFSQNQPDAIPGVITVLRGCLGDFAALLNLNIFDPCLSVIFASALALQDRETSLQELQSNPQMQQAMNKCDLYLTSKQAELQRMSKVVGQTNDGGTTPSSTSLSPQSMPSLSGEASS